MTRTAGVRATLLGVLVSLSSLGAVCEAPQSPSAHLSGMIHITAWALPSSRAPGVHVQLERWHSGAGLGGTGFAQLVETRTVVSNAVGEASIEGVTPGQWKFKVVGTDEWIPTNSESAVDVSAGRTVEVTVWVQPHP